YFKNKIGNIFSKKMSIILLLIILLMLPSTSSLYYNYGHEKGTELENDWITLQLWCKGNTPKDSLFLIPPYVQDFRIWSERSVFPTWDDGTMGTYNYSFSKEWWYRMQELGYTRHNYKTYSNNNYNNISELALTNLSKKYGINYLITDRTRRLNYTLVHESKFSRIYKFSD
ncbi:MAG: hypothetical protein NTY22_08200, partial [Proteobacteria bacterium]|nr:hypothetical protein [Pseudomonadota bacterium]